MEKNLKKINLVAKNAQVSIFVIVAIVILAVVGFYFILKETGVSAIPKEIEPVYLYYLSCIEQDTSNGALLLGQQGGYIQPPEFSPGSEYMPFSSQLDFFGTGVPYWYYISGNGILKEQKPSLAKVESQLNEFLEEQINLCDFSEFEKKGFELSIGDVTAETTIRDSSIDVSVNQDLVISFGSSTWKGSLHKKTVNSNLGKFYEIAEKIYEKNKDEMFLENYGIDVLRLYAPVDGSEIGCSPKIWQADNVKDELMNALEANIPAVKIKGDYYKLNEKENEYFIQDIGEDVDFNVNFMYSKQWPLKLEIWPSEDGLLKAEPVGLQEGMGMLGFCYTPYHFVYDFAYPVLVQLYSGSEIFQFPVVVFIEKNNPREALDVEGLPDVVPELCEHKNTKLEVYTYNTNLEPVSANIKFKCFDTTCDIGKTSEKDGEQVLSALFPQCVNGFIVANSEGYKTGKYQISTIEENAVNIVLDKEYELELGVKKDNNEIKNDYAVITFTKESEVKTIAYPEQNKIKLTEGEYEIKAYIYGNSTIKLQGSSTQKCVDIPKSGILGFFGATKEKCFTLTIPEQVVSFAVSGGGKQNYYITEQELKDSKKIVINADGFGIPTKVEELQVNYNQIEVSRLDVRFE